MSTLEKLQHERIIELKVPKSNAFLLLPKSMIGTIIEKSTVRQALEKMRNGGYTSIPVLTENGEYFGTITEGDFLWYLYGKSDLDIKRLEEELVSSIVRPTWNPPVKLDAPIDVVLERVLNQNFVPVVDDRNYFMGIITRKSVLQYYNDMMKL